MRYAPSDKRAYHVSTTLFFTCIVTFAKNWPQSDTLIYLQSTNTLVLSHLHTSSQTHLTPVHLPGHLQQNLTPVYWVATMSMDNTAYVY